MKTKLSITLSALLIGSALLTGCGDSGSSTPTADTNATNTNTTTPEANTTTEVNNTVAVAQGPQFTTAMLAGKTFYTSWPNYQIDYNANTVTSVTYNEDMQFNFSANASTFEAISLAENQNYGIFPIAIDKDLLIITGHGGDILIKEQNGNMLISNGGDIAVWTPTQGAYKTAYEALLADEQLTVAKLTANPWYKLYILSDNGSRAYACQAMLTYDSNGTVTSTYMKDGALTTETSLDDKVANAVDGVVHDVAFAAATPTAIFGHDYTIKFKNKADVARYISTDESVIPSNIDACLANYPN
ncbi:MAG: hypothetical protein WC665_12425 [Sulfurimonas sp.]|jgi:hypothetical protein